MKKKGICILMAVVLLSSCSNDTTTVTATIESSKTPTTSFSRSSLIDQLEYEGFTYDQAVYGVEANGY